MPILVDSNVLLDLSTRHPEWFDWSFEQISFYGDREILGINQLIAAEISVSYSSLETMESALTESRIVRFSLPWEAAFLAGRCFVDYKQRGGQRRSPMPDFYIGAHALISGMPLLTRDAQRYRSYFPRLRLITPD